MTWTVGDVMSRPAVTTGPSATVPSALEVMRHRRISALPVVGARGALVGLVSQADAMRQAAGEVGLIMTTDLTTIGPDASIAAAARLMIRRDVTHLPVLGDSGRLIGIVTRSDLLRVFLRSDESIRKEIANSLLRELPLLGRGRVKVDVSDGVVRLRGDADSTALTALLLRLVAAVPGVAGVENDLQAPPPAEKATYA